MPKNLSNIAQSKKIRSYEEWRKYIQKNGLPKNMTSNPMKVYKKQWKGMGDFLGTGRIADQNKTFFSFKKSKFIVSKLKFKNATEYYNQKKLKKISDKIPFNPDLIYKRTNEWKGWPDFLGKKSN